MRYYSLTAAMLFAVLGGGARPASASEPPPPLLEKVVAEHLPNAIWLHPRVSSGGQPAGEAGFAELQRLGFKTIVSVDGARPDVEMAKKHGLRYVHLPHGYDGISQSRLAELAKAVRELPGPIYIHCHHGKHRSPAAAAAACIGAGLIDPRDARQILVIAGTSDAYRGLYQAAQGAKPLDAKVLDAMQTEFPAAAKLPPLAEAMVSIEQAHDHLRLLAANQWRPLKDRPALEPDHEALLLKEHFTELLRSKEIKDRPPKLQALMREGEAATRDLESSLRDWIAAGPPDRVPEHISPGFERVTNNCIACHKQFRDVPLQEKR